MSDPANRHRSTVSLAAELGCSPDAVARARQRLNLVPEWVEVPTPRGVQRMRVDRIGRRAGRRAKLTPRQRALLSEVADLPGRLARWKANRVLDASELAGVADEALVVAVRHWRPGGGRAWRAYAWAGILRAFRRAFHRRRQRLRRERALLGEPVAPVRGGGMLQRLLEASGVERLTGEWMAGLDGGKPRTKQDLAKFWGVPLDTVEGFIAATQAALLESP